MTHAEHPLIAAHGADAAPDLVGESLESEAMVGDGEGAGDGVAGAFQGLNGEESVDGFFEAALKEVLEAFEGDAGTYCVLRIACREMKAVEGVEEEEGADAFVEVFAFATEGVERGAFGQQLVGGEIGAGFLEGAVALGGVPGGDEADQLGHEGGPGEVEIRNPK